MRWPMFCFEIFKISSQRPLRENTIRCLEREIKLCNIWQSQASRTRRANIFSQETRQSSITFLQHYFEFLQNRKLQVLSEKVTLDQSGIKTSIFSSFHLTIQKLQNENEDLEAFLLLLILGILDGSFIHQSFTRKFCKNE